MRILIRTSRWAIWARGLGSVALPLVVIPVVLHRLGLITSDVFQVVILGAGIVAALGVIAAVVALGRLWQTGDQGWSRAFVGLLFGALSLVPFGWYGSLMLKYPAVTDIATTSRDLMPLVFDAGTQAMPTPKIISAAEMAQVFPNIETRDYPLGLAQTFELVQRLVADNGWDVRILRQTDEVGQLNARITTLAGWREEAVIRVTGSFDRSTVDMRSASLYAFHDFGSNGARIEQFLVALDDAVTTLLRDNPNANQPDDNDTTEDDAPVISAV